MTYAQHVSTRRTPQSEATPSKNQVENSAGGFVFLPGRWDRLNRFLILGNEGGSYYASERKMTQRNAQCVMDCFAEDPGRTIQTIVDVSVEGRAPKNDPAIFALAMLSTDKRALEAMPKVCRIGTHLFQFVDAARHFRGRGRAFLTAIRDWYMSRETDALIYQLIKYQQRDGWSHRDLLRMCKPRCEGSDSAAAVRWAAKGGIEGVPATKPYEQLLAFEAARVATSANGIVNLITDHGLPRECIPNKFLKEEKVWDALFSHMPITAMIRNLGKMSAVGLLKPMSGASRMAADRLRDPERLARGRVHPIQLLVAHSIYAAGRGLRGSLTWVPDAGIIDALDDAFYLAFDQIEPTGKRHLIGLDVSGSMTCGHVAGTFLTPRIAAAALSMATIKTEPACHTMAFTDRLQPLALSPKMRLDDVVKATSCLPFGRTDCSLPMQYALDHSIEVDCFVVYTDSETWCGGIHPCQALRRYREKMGINAKLIVVGMTANEFTIADPSDAGMLDVVGFSTDVPQVMREFALM